jgi:signal transduction histidine kinase
MLAPPTPADEHRRLGAVHSLGLLDTLPEPRFDRITRLACHAADAPIAVVCLVDQHRQWFKSRQGLDATETDRRVSFCGHTILRDEPLIVPDATEDARFADNPLVTGAPNIRFYAGHPIHAPGGARVGTLAVIDTRPRRASPQQLAAIADLATMVDVELLTLRFNVATRAAGVGVHERSVGGGDMWWSEAMWEISGQDKSRFRPSFDGWLALVHPDDRDRVRANAGGPDGERTIPSLQYRIVRPDGTIRHVQSIESSTERQAGVAVRIAGITLDISDRIDSEALQFGQQQKLRDSSHQAGMAEMATGVLHSVGNAVNSLGISNATLRRDLKDLRLDQLEQATALISANRNTLAAFFTSDERGRHLPDYLPALSAHVASNVQAAHAELDFADQLLEHIRDIVSAQEERAHRGGLREPVDLIKLIDATLLVQAFELSPIEVVRHHEDLPPVTTDRHKLKLILVNLLNNARDAVIASAVQPGRIVVRVTREQDHAVIVVDDSGIGMSGEVLSSLWRFGFTTKPDGKGFDLHNSANAAREIGATIAAESAGANMGSRFIVRLPWL